MTSIATIFEASLIISIIFSIISFLALIPFNGTTLGGKSWERSRPVFTILCVAWVLSFIKIITHGTASDPIILYVAVVGIIFESVAILLSVYARRTRRIKIMRRRHRNIPIAQELRSIEDEAGGRTEISQPGSRKLLGRQQIPTRH